MDIEPQAVAIPKSTHHLDNGKYGPIFPKTPACHGFTMIANVKPGRGETIRNYGQRLAKALADDPYILALLEAPLPALGPLRRRHAVHVPGDSLRYGFLLQVPQNPVVLFRKAGIDTAFENLEVFPLDWKTNTAAFIGFIREHQLQQLPRIRRIPVRDE